ncbi:MAG TPA: VWA domain-containing protein [Streptosporangiaceae bacterium]
MLVNFARALRSAGLAVGTGDAAAFCSAMTALDPSDLVDLYWGGRTTLVSKREDIAVYDEVFRRYFLAADSQAAGLLVLKARLTPSGADAVLTLPAPDPDAAGDEEQAVLGWMASDVESLKRKAFGACTPDELAALRRIMARIRLTPPRRRTRRSGPASSGRTPDLRRTLRDSMRQHGEPARLVWRERRVRLRPMIFILDISGSMADYSRNLLQFAYCARRAPVRVEVFCFGTRLTRITKALDTRNPDAALERAAREVFDWEGGTRIGASLDEFVRTWGRRGLCRGGVVMICSDGLDRGDPELLSTAMDRLSRLCHTLLWVNPHKGSDPGFRPVTLGMMVAAPHIDRLLSGHDLRSLEELAALLPTLT